jgi:hypothetical protein
MSKNRFNCHRHARQFAGFGGSAVKMRIGIAA